MDGNRGLSASTIQLIKLWAARDDQKPKKGATGYLEYNISAMAEDLRKEVKDTIGIVRALRRKYESG
jgi:hypothetical protein